MAVKIEALSDLSLEEQSEVLEKMAEYFLDSNKWKTFNNESESMTVDIEVDGTVYKVPKPVNELLNAIYRMYEREVMLRDKKD